MSGSIQKIQTENGWHVNLVAPNEQIVFTTEVYETEQAASKAVQWIEKFMRGEPVKITKRL